MRTRSLLASSIVATVALAVTVPVAAQPPAHAPAHGFRAKQEKRASYAGRAGIEWTQDYGVTSGNCDRRAIATALGSIAGAVIANRVADEDNRTVATLIGAAAGALIGNRIGRNIDKSDEACIGHALELGETGQAVTWVNDDTGVSYRIVPGADRRRDG
ncbi:MAG: glycine zipper 2TM domain-containing protein, partial [Gammaproteobacteria bacterium]|nr:glycine zipper 2TM domain-containing protein [Gammaproteobacteria bacterium]